MIVPQQEVQRFQHTKEHINRSFLAMLKWKVRFACCRPAQRLAVVGVYTVPRFSRSGTTSQSLVIGMLVDR